MARISGVQFLQAKRKIGKAITYLVGRIDIQGLCEEADLKHLEALKEVMELVEQAAFEQRGSGLGMNEVGNPQHRIFPTHRKVNPK